MSEKAAKKVAESPRKAGPRAHHVVVHVDQEIGNFDQVLVFGTKLEALEHIFEDGQSGWKYEALGNGQAFGNQA